MIILAAGNSSRLGKPKQLLDFKGKSLLRRITDEASQDPDHRVCVVLGALHETIQKELTGTKVEKVINLHWEKGMSGSIKTGLTSLLQTDPGLEQCIITVCDQPYVNAMVFKGLNELRARDQKGIIATGFAGTWGVPVLFSNRYFKDLLTLEGPEGAKKIIKKYRDDMAIFSFEPARFDIDTEEDYNCLKQ